MNPQSASAQLAARSSAMPSPRPALYGVPRSAMNADLVELSGGAHLPAALARAHVDAGRPLEAIHLLDVALGVDTENLDSLSVKKAALNQLRTAGGGSNLSETMWLKSEIAAIDAALPSTGT